MLEFDNKECVSNQSDTNLKKVSFKIIFYFLSTLDFNVFFWSHSRHIKDVFKT